MTITRSKTSSSWSDGRFGMLWAIVRGSSASARRRCRSTRPSARRLSISAGARTSATTSPSTRSASATSRPSWCTIFKIVHQLGLEVADALLAYGDVVAEVRAPADIDNRRADGLVERHRRLAEALDPRTIAQSIPKRPSDHDADVFDRVMVIYIQIAAGGDLEIEESVSRKALEHVIEERHARFRLAATGAVELERDSHSSLSRLAFDFRTAFRLHRRQACDWRSLVFTLQADFVLLHFDFRLLSLSLWHRRCAAPSRARAPRTLPSAPDARPTARAPQSRPSTPRLYWFVSGNRMRPVATRTALLPPSAARDWGPPGSRRGEPGSAGRERRRRQPSPWAAIATDCARRARDAPAQSRWPDRMLP